MRETIKNASQRQVSKVIVAGLSNVYTHYITTYEEYQRQRYEAASTIYGPNTLLAYQQQYTYLIKKMLADEEIPQGTPPPNLHDSQLSFVPGVILDTHPVGHPFGKCVLQPPTMTYPGDSVVVRFISGHPRNNLMLDKSFLAVERLAEEDGSWELVATDADWETQFIWHRTNIILGESEVEIHWWVPKDVFPGTYRIRHFGYHKELLVKNVVYYEGTSNQFYVSLDVPQHRRRHKPSRRIRPVTSFQKYLSKFLKNLGIKNKK